MTKEGWQNMAFSKMLVSAFSGAATGSVFSAITRPLRHLTNAALPTNIVDLGQLARIHKTGWFREFQIGALARSNGFMIPNLTAGAYNYAQHRVPNNINQRFPLKRDETNLNRAVNPIEAVLWLAQYVPTIPETNLLRNRNLIDDQLCEFMHTMNCEHNRPLAQAMKELRYEIPGASDLIRFAVREAFTPEIVQRYGYHKEFPRQILEWMEKQGYGQNIGRLPQGCTYEDGSPADTDILTWIWLYWFAHWELPSPTQGYEMVFRLYPNSDYGASPDALRIGETFSENDMATLLKTQDYPVYWRNKMLAINYLPYTRVDTRRMFNLGIINEAQVYHSYRAQGYPDDRAKGLLRFAERERQLYQVSQNFREIKTFTQLYVDGFISIERLRELLGLMGLTDTAIQRNIELATMRYKIREYKDTIAALQTEFNHGQIDEIALREQLSVLGMVPAAIDRQIRIMIRRRIAKIKPATVAKLIRWMKMGIIGEVEFTNRLIALNYTLRDIGFMIRQARAEVFLQQQQAALRSNQQFMKNLQRQQKEQVREVKQAVKERIAADKERVKTLKERANKALAPFTEKNLVTWGKKKLLTPEQIRDILTMKGWRAGAILSFLLANDLIKAKEDIETNGELTYETT